MPSLLTAPYLDQAARWPASGHHILAQYDEAAVVVYQAYRPAIGHYAAAHGRFGGDFSLDRMSWIKPNFLWMMYRSAWGTAEGQTVVLAVWLQRVAFDALLEQAVPSTYDAARSPDRADWQRAVAESSVRMQWDPDHDPTGAPLARRALQLGLRGAALAGYARDWLVRVEDISDFVAEQRPHATIGGDLARLLTPRERVYPVADVHMAARLGIGAAMPDRPA
ncbi:MAG TPA: DUF4291 domain-containing protein [Ktedonobacterales bacterium]